MFLLDFWENILEGVGDTVVASPAVMIDQQIAGDAGEPCGKAAVGCAIARQGSVDAQKNLLAQVFGFGRIASEAITEIVDAPGMAVHKLLPCCTFSPEAALNQLSVLLQSSLSSQLASPCGLIVRNERRGRKVPRCGGMLAGLQG